MKKILPDGTVADVSPAEMASLPASLTTAQAPTKYRVSKDLLIRALVARNLYTAFNTALNALPPYARDLWAIEPTFDVQDPFIMEFLPLVQAALGLTDDELKKLLLSCRTR